MSQIVPASVVLGPGQTGLAIGYRVLTLDGTEYSAYTVTGVAETSVLGTYRVADGVTVPDAGGYIVFGTAGTDLAEATVESSLPVDAAVDAILDEAVEGAYTMRQILRLLAAHGLGKASGGGTSTLAYRDLADTKDRITQTVNAVGNRTSSILDAS